MKLELKHILPYLTADLKIIREGFSFEHSLIGIQMDSDVIHDAGKTPLKYIKPILLPLSYAQWFLSSRFDDDIDIRTFCCEEYLSHLGFESLEEVFEHKVEWIPLGLFNLLVKYHFDVFDLIPNKLAIDKNKIPT